MLINKHILDDKYIFKLASIFEEKTKSGNIICYFLQGVVFRKFSVFRDKRVRIIETFNSLEQHKDEVKIIILVDDYVGSGDTVHIQICSSFV